MPANPITVKTTVDAPRSEAWHLYTEAEHVINWNFPSEGWHCPAAANDLTVGGKFKITMAEKQGNLEVELEGTYDEIEEPNHIAYTLDNGRKVTVDFTEQGEKTDVSVQFEPGDKQPAEEQKKHWQAILDNFATYASNYESVAE
ncbi:SRPBCC domain-containing protein [Lewinella sp. IMCC34183]|uniref:SRPBCC domain-containing protein n=1 Tax=Lewinella sp. IMCC34183 TaxID=2248762 RepID=UPI000E23CCAF|nr:SRPBCC domain-containing protein [Lewinella sp. IMCC34183]